MRIVAVTLGLVAWAGVEADAVAAAARRVRRALVRTLEDVAHLIRASAAVRHAVAQPRQLVQFDKL